MVWDWKMQEVNSVSCRCKSGQILKPFKWLTQREVTSKSAERQTKTNGYIFYDFPPAAFSSSFTRPNTTFQAAAGNRSTELLSTSLPSFKTNSQSWASKLSKLGIWERKHALWHIGGSLQDCETSDGSSPRSLVWPFFNAWTDSAAWRQEVISSPGSTLWSESGTKEAAAMNEDQES